MLRTTYAIGISLKTNVENYVRYKISSLRNVLIDLRILVYGTI